MILLYCICNRNVFFLSGVFSIWSLFRHWFFPSRKKSVHYQEGSQKQADKLFSSISCQPMECKRTSLLHCCPKIYFFFVPWSLLLFFSFLGWAGTARNAGTSGPTGQHCKNQSWLIYVLYHQPAFDRGKYLFVKSLVLALNFKSCNFDVVFLFRPLMPPSMFQFFLGSKRRERIARRTRRKRRQGNRGVFSEFVQPVAI